MVKVGDRIKVICSNFLSCMERETGTVIEIDEQLEILSVRFDSYSPGRHDCNGLCEDGHGFWLSIESLKFGEIKVVSRKKNNLLV